MTRAENVLKGTLTGLHDRLEGWHLIVGRGNEGNALHCIFVTGKAVLNNWTIEIVWMTFVALSFLASCPCVQSFEVVITALEGRKRTRNEGDYQNHRTKQPSEITELSSARTTQNDTRFRVLLNSDSVHSASETSLSFVMSVTRNPINRRRSTDSDPSLILQVSMKTSTRLLSPERAFVKARVVCKPNSDSFFSSSDDALGQILRGFGDRSGRRVSLCLERHRFTIMPFPHEIQTR